MYTGSKPDCKQFQGGVSGNAYTNDYLWMRNADVDSSANTFNSTSATVQVPSGAKVVKAMLYWSGNTGLVKGVTGARCTSTALGTLPDWVAPSGSPQSQQVSLSVAGTTTSVAPASFHQEADDKLTTGQPQYYSASSDVSAMLANLPSGSSQSITVGNVWAPQGYGCYGGWSLALVYDYGDYNPAIADSAAREVIMYDGHVRLQAADTAGETVAFTGFTVQGPGTRAGLVLYEGDRSITGDFAQYSTTSQPTLTALPSAFGDTNNIGVGVADGSTPYTAYTGSTFTNGSVDAKSWTLANATTGDKQINLKLGTTGDSYLLQTTVLSVPTASVKIEKSFDGTADTQTVLSGGTPSFTIKVTNAGSTNLTNVRVADALAPNCARNLGTMQAPPAASSTVTYTCTGPATTAAFTNTAKVSARTPLDADIDRDDTSRVEVAGIDLTKTASSPSVPRGQSVTWTMTVRNTGSVPLTGVAVADALAPSCARADLGTLAAGASTSYTCTSTVTAGFTNSATATGRTANNLIPTATATAPVAASGITVDKSHDLDFATPGQDVTFTIRVTNNGEVPLTAVTVTDADYPACSRTLPGTLQPGASADYTCVVVAGDADFTNAVTVTGTPPGDAPKPSGKDSDDVDVRTPGITIDKSTSTPIIHAGDTATFQIVVTNSGETDLTAVRVADPLAPDCARSNLGTLRAGESTTYSCTLTNVTKGLVNVATASGQPPGGGDRVTGDHSARVRVANITIDKRTSTPVVAIGAPVTFTITVTNTGGIDLPSAVVTDPRLADCARDVGPILAGASVVYTCTDPAVSEAYTNVATVTAAIPGGPTLTDDDSAAVATTGIEVSKTARTAVVPVGQRGSYEITVTNRGSVALIDVVVSDPAAPDCARTFTAIPAGDSRSFTCSSPVLTRGQTNVAAASGVPSLDGSTPAGPVQRDSDDATIRLSGIKVTKAGQDTPAAPGATVTFSITVTNTGEVDLADVAVADPSYPACARANLGDLAPGATTSYVCSVTAGSADVENTATATGTPPDGPPPTDSSTSTINVKASSIQVIKVAKTPIIGVGDDATWELTVKNTGAIALRDVHVSDPLAGACVRDFETLAAGASETWTCNSPNLTKSLTNTATATAVPQGGGTPVTDSGWATARVADIDLVKETSTPVVVKGAKATYRITVTNNGDAPLTGVAVADPANASCSKTIGNLAVGAAATFECTSADLDEGLTNRATVTGTAGSVKVSDADTARVRVSAIQITKTASDAVSPIGSEVTFTISVRNSGEVPLTDVTVADPRVPSCTRVVGSLAAGERANYTCTATVGEGGIANTATVTGVPPSGPNPRDTDTADVKPSGIAITKTVDRETAAPGSTLTWTILVTNTGQVPLTDIKVTDRLAPDCARDGLGPLAPGASTTYTCTGTMSTGDFVNEAKATGTPPEGPRPTDTGKVTTDVRTPKLRLIKTTTTPVVAIGGTAEFSLSVTNNGEVDLTDVTVADPVAPGCVRTFPTLAIGETQTWTCSLANVTASVTNVATATGTPVGGGTPATDTDRADVSVAGLTLVKDTSTPVVDRDGTASFTVQVTNSGAVDLTGVAVTDPAAPGCAATIGTLAAGQTRSIECTVTGVTAGFTNTASVVGTPPSGANLQASDDAAVQVADVTIVKTADPEVIARGGTASFTMTVTNTGEVPLSSVLVADQSAPDCARSIGDLTVGQVVTYSCTLADVQASLTNVATVSGQNGGVVTTATDDAQVSVAQLTIQKTTSTPIVERGGTAAFTVVVTNEGDTELTDVTVADPLAPTCASTIGTLAAGASRTVDCAVTGVSAGFTNTATVTGTPPGGAELTGESSASVQVASIGIVKEAIASVVPTGGDAQFRLTVTNTGEVELNPVQVTDPLATDCARTFTRLAAGASETWTCTQSALTTSLTNVATAVGTAGTVTVTNSDDATVSVAGLTLSKQTSTPIVDRGGEASFTLVVTNTGDVALSNVAVDDPRAPDCSTTIGTLPAGASRTIDCSVPGVTDGFTNTATVTGTPPVGDPLTDRAQAAVQVADVEITKTARTEVVHTGETATFELTVTNTGEVALGDVAVTDPLAPGCARTIGTLAVGATQTWTCTVANLTAQLTNVASVSGTAGAVTTTDSDDATVGVADLTLDKQAGLPSGTTAGSTIDYTFVLTNTGSAPLTAVSVSDPKVGTVSCPADTLAAGAAMTCTATYTLTQADVDAGHVANTATGTGTPPTGDPLTPTDSTDTPIASGPGMTLVKTAGTPSGTHAGDTIEYSFLLANTGNVTLTSVGVSDPKVGAVDCPVDTLAPQASTTCTATYTLTQADVDAGEVVNTATGTGTPPGGGDPEEPTDTVTTPIDRTPGMTLDKQAGTPSGSSAGSTIEYSFLLANTGNVTLTAVSVSDPKVGAVDCPVDVLAPSATTTCTATYTLTQADVDAGHVANTATGTGTPPSGDPVTPEDSTDTPIASGPGMTLVKSAGTPSGNSAGDTIAYSFLLTNTGNVTLTSVGVSDPKVGAVDCPVDTLAPQATTTCTATYTLTQADVDAGEVVNAATGTGTPPGGGDPEEPTDSVTTPIDRTPGMTLDKQAGTPSGNIAGSTIEYSFVLANTGNVTLTSVAVSDPKVGAVDCPVDTLAPSETTTCTATYTLTQADVDAGHVANTAIASGTPPTGDPVTPEDSTDTPITAGPGMTLVKSAGTPSGNSAGSTIEYSFLLTNTGNVTLTAVSVSDPKVGAVDCPVDTLAPEATTTCTATYTLTQADVDAGEVVNTATGTGTPPGGGDPVTPIDTVTTPIPSNPGLTLDKQSGVPSGNSAGDTIEYSFVLTNTGNVTLTAVAMSDPKVGAVDCPVDVLAPSETTTCTATYTLTQADVDAGHVANTATGTGTPPTGDPVTPEDSTDTPIASGPGMTLVKSAGTPSGNNAGSTIEYSFLLTNTGNVTLTAVSVSDPKVGAVDCPVDTLAPHATTTCTATYTLTQADVDAGEVVNTATGTGTPPDGGDPVTPRDTVTTPITSEPGMTLDKQAGVLSGNSAGDTIEYTFVLTNTGNVTLTAVSVSDPKVGAVDCPVDVLAPQATTTCTATYTLMQADVDAGHVANTATGTGTPPTGDPVTPEDSTDTPITAGPGMTLVKTAGVPSGNSAGDTIEYSFLLTNTGNVTLASVGVSDPKVGAVDCPVDTLAPQATTTCTATYTLTQADVDAGEVVNTATGSGTPPGGGDPVTPTDSVTTPIPSNPGLSLDKQAGTPSGNIAGSTIAYTFVLVNTGNVTLTAVAVSDPKVGAVDCPVDVLAPSETTTCTATYTLTQADVDAGHVANTATGTGTPPSGDPVTPEDSTDTPITAGPGMTLVKSAGTPSGNSAGSTIEYSFLLTNTGNVTLTAVSVSDPKVGAVDCPVDTLAPQATTTCTATYTLTQADVDAGEVVNTATGTGTPPGGGDPVTPIDTVTTPIPSNPGLTLDKQAGVPSGNSAGDTIEYSFVLVNTGNVTLTAVAVSDPKVGAVDCPVDTLAPSETTTCTARYTLTQTDVDAGHVANTATGTGTPPSGDPVTPEDSTDTPIASAPGMSLEKRAGTPSGTNAGDTIEYSFVLTNTGNVTLTAVSVSDPKVGAVDCPVDVLAPSATTTCIATYTLTQADVDAGEVVNTATGTGTPPTGDPVTPTDTVTTPIPSDPGMSLEKRAGTPSGNSVGDTIEYSFVLTNTGNVTLTAVSVSDPKVGAVDCPVDTLAPKATTTCTATYTLTQADVDAGEVVNTATATGTPPGGGDPEKPTDSVTTPIPSDPGMSLDKQAGTPSGNNAGDTIEYAFVLTNTGNVTLTAVAVNDPKVGAVECPVDTLAPKASTTCTATYTLTQVDVDAGHVANTATGTGTPPKGDPVTPEDSTDTPISPEPGMTLDKQAGTPSGNRAGDTIAYSFVLTNTGNVTLTDVSVSDPKVGAVDCPVDTLAPKASTTCTATYTLTQADVDAGEVVNTATATGTPPGGGDPERPTDTVTTPIPSDPGMSLDKQAGTPSGNNAGDTIEYSFVLTNTGNVTLTDVSVSDPKVGAVDCPVDTLAPKATTTCTATYTLTQADVDAGEVVNTATGTGTPPGGGDPEKPTDSVTTPIPSNPGLSLDKQAGVPSGNHAGDTIDYSFVLTNTGNVTLTAVSVSDPKVGAVDCPVDTLAPQASTTCSATYTLTQADIDAGHVANTATGTGTPPTGDPVAPEDSTDTPVLSAPGLSLDKQAGVPSGNHAGDTIDYSFVLTNTGNVTLTAVSVSDPKVGAVDCPVDTLAPQASTTCSATYTLTQADIDAGHVANTATGTGTPPTGDPVTPEDSTDTPIASEPGIALDKQAGAPSGNNAGDTIAYTFLVTNTGNMTLTAVAVDDPKVGAVDCPVDTLAPQATTTCTATYTLTQPDVDAGQVVNTATASGTPPTGDPVTADDAVTTPIEHTPGMTLVKSAGTPSGNSVGDTIVYSFALTNTGNVTLTAVAVDDPKVGAVDCPVDTLAPQATTTCTATYTLTQADVDAGEVVNTATATGTPPTGDPVTPTDTITTPIASAPGLTLDKQAGTPSGNNAGDTIAYTFVVTNTGNVTLTAVAVNDPKVGAVDCPVDVLAPKATMTCTATYTLTQADVDAGHVANTATASGTPPTGDPLMPSDSTDTPLVQAPGLALVKSSDATGPLNEGDLVAFSFEVTNTGNTTLTGITLTDSMVTGVTCPSTTLAPGASMTCTADSYRVTAQDAKNGQFTNVADVTADSCSQQNGCVTVRATDSLTLTVNATPQPKPPLPQPPLPQTGSNAALEVGLLGAGLLVVGAVLLVAARRRRVHKS